MCMLGVAIIARALYIQIKQGPELKEIAREMHTRFETMEAERGNILNEEGTLLSTSIPEFDVHVDFSVIDTALFAEQIDSLCRCMAQLFVNKGKSAEDYKEDFVRAYDKGTKYYPLGRRLKYYEYEALRSFPIFIKGKGSGGFIAESREKRRLPYGELARRTLGIFRDSNTNGLEAKYNKDLAGINGRRVVQKAAGGLWVPVEGSEVDPVNGKDIVTTLDMDVQAVAHDALLANLQKYKCLYGTCIVMEVATGKIRTLVNLGIQKDSSYREDFNYAAIPTEPGSTFKLATLTALLSDRFINVDSGVDIQGGRKQFANRTMQDSHPNPSLGNMPIWKAYAISSNVGMAKLADRYYHDHPEKFVAHLKRLHLDKYTGIDLMGERQSRITTPGTRYWSKTSLPWMAIGYGVMITPLHTCMMYNALANNGKMMRPYLVSAVREYGRDIKTTQPEVLTTLGDAEVVRQLRKCTRAVVAEGTGKDIASPYYTMSGKTGTAQVADKGIKYSDHVYQGSYVGYMPAEDPKYTICVVIRTSAHSSSYYGGTIAAPVFRMVADKIFSRNMGAWSSPLDSMARTASSVIPARAATAGAYDILMGKLKRNFKVPGNELRSSMVCVVSDTLHGTRVEKTPVYRGVMPDVTGMTLKDAVYVLENYGVRVNISGRGKVTAQSVPAGTHLLKGQNVMLQLG